MTDRLTYRPTDHAIRSLTIGGAHSGEAKFSYCLRLQQVFTGAVDSTDRINFSNQQLYSAVSLNGLQLFRPLLEIKIETKNSAAFMGFERKTLAVRY